MMIKDIKDLDETGHRLRVMWGKLNNFLRNFGLEYLPVRESLIKGEYGSDWTNVDKWLLRNVGISDKSILDLMNVRKRTFAHDEQEKVDQLKKAQVKARRLAKEEKALEVARKKQERAAAQTVKNAIAEDKKLSQAAWDKWQAGEKRKKARKVKRVTLNDPPKPRRAKSKKSKEVPASAHTNGNDTNGEAALSALADELRALRDRDASVRKDWIKVTLAKAKILAKARGHFPRGSNAAFSGWLEKNGFDTWINDHDRAALIHFGENIELARSILEKSKSWSVQLIWEDEMKSSLASVSNSTYEGDISEENQGDSLH